MNTSRRDFLRFFAMSAAMAAATGVGLPTLALAADDNKPDKWVKGVCRYCGTGCGVMVGVKNGKAVSIQGDPNNHNAGLLCGLNGVMANGIGVGGLPGILSIQPTYWQVFGLAMVIAVVVPIVLTTVIYQRKFRQGTLQIV